MWLRLFLLWVVFDSLALVAFAGEPDWGGVREEHVWIPMSDGVKLSAYLYFPMGNGPWPVLYQQRYSNFLTAETRIQFSRLAAAGYVVVAENFRGAQLSEGTWVSYRSLGWGNQRDGYDTVEWVAAQPWSNGKVGTFGGSQSGIAQNFLAVTQPPHLLAQYMWDTALSLFHEGYRIGGTVRPDSFKTMEAHVRNPEDNRRLLEEWFRHPTYDDYWAVEDATRFMDKMNVPCFIVGSWYDFMSVGSIDSFVGRQHHGGPNARGFQHLTLGPWLHGSIIKPNEAGALTYPENARFDMLTHMISWFDHYLKDIDNSIEREPAVRYYVMGAVGEPGAPGNEWRTTDDWPVSTTETAYYLHSGGGLSTESPDTGPAKPNQSMTTLLADPYHPAEIPGTRFPGASDARPFEHQAEVRTFTTETLTKPVEWTGKVRAEMFITSTAKDTDFIVRVSDVYPDGRSILIVDSIRRSRYREGYEREVLLKENEIATISFDVGSMSQIFNRGHRIRVTIASTGAPYYEVNPNTGEPLAQELPEKMIVAKNSLIHTRAYASRLIAPVRN